MCAGTRRIADVFFVPDVFQKARIGAGILYSFGEDRLICHDAIVRSEDVNLQGAVQHVRCTNYARMYMQEK